MLNKSFYLITSKANCKAYYWVGWSEGIYLIRLIFYGVRWLAARTKQGELYGGCQAEDWMNWDADRIDGRVPNLA